MRFNNHDNLVGLHAPFSPSQPAWLRYDDEKLLKVYGNKKAAERGTELHDWAMRTIRLGLKQPRSNKTIYQYVNDAIGFKMEPEVVLFYSIRFFGTADTISFRNNFLRIHDLKTGVIKAKMEQLLCYAALFCLEYRINPAELSGVELRIYQNDAVEVYNPTAEEIQTVMDIIVHNDQLIAKHDEEA